MKCDGCVHFKNLEAESDAWYNHLCLACPIVGCFHTHEYCINIDGCPMSDEESMRALLYRLMTLDRDTVHARRWAAGRLKEKEALRDDLVEQIIDTIFPEKKYRVRVEGEVSACANIVVEAKDRDDAELMISREIAEGVGDWKFRHSDQVYGMTVVDVEEV